MDKLESCVSASLDAEDQLFPLLPELFQDLDEIGVRVKHVEEILSHATLKEADHILDLGCGKGSVARAISKNFGVSTLGLDAVQGFINEARQKTPGTLNCQFELADIRTWSRPIESPGFDLVCLLAMGAIFGPLPEKIQRLRDLVKPGAYMLFDDAYLDTDQDFDPEDFVDCFDYQTTRQLMTQYGDEIIAELVIDMADDEDWYRESTERIMSRALQLAAKYPEAADELIEFGRRQCEDVALLGGPVVGSLWLLRKSG